MKKLKMAICGVIAATVLITGCSSGVSQEEYDKVVSENEALKSAAATTTTPVTTTTAPVTTTTMDTEPEAQTTIEEFRGLTFELPNVHSRKTQEDGSQIALYFTDNILEGCLSIFARQLQTDTSALVEDTSASYQAIDMAIDAFVSSSDGVETNREYANVSGYYAKNVEYTCEVSGFKLVTHATVFFGNGYLYVIEFAESPYVENSFIDSYNKLVESVK